jgi:hypothetical protein
MTTIKTHGFISLVKFQNGQFGVANGDKVTTNLSLDVAKNLFNILKQLSK